MNSDVRRDREASFLSSSNLRYTGDWPPPEVLQQYANWEYALDEESAEGQDETTLRPSINQESIDSEVNYTAGWVTQANGQRLLAILELDDNAIEGVTAFLHGAWSWTVRRSGQPTAWTVIGYEWMPEFDRPPIVSITDREVFPLVVESVLPWFLDKSPLRATIQLAV